MRARRGLSDLKRRSPARKLGSHVPQLTPRAPWSRVTYRKCAGPDEPTAYAEEARAEVVNRDREPRLLSGCRTRPTSLVEPVGLTPITPLQAKHLPSGEWVSLVKSSLGKEGEVESYILF